MNKNISEPLVVISPFKPLKWWEKLFLLFVKKHISSDGDIIMIYQIWKNKIYIRRH
jgi:hypothetical protein